LFTTSHTGASVTKHYRLVPAKRAATPYGWEVPRMSHNAFILIIRIKTEFNQNQTALTGLQKPYASSFLCSWPWSLTFWPPH